MVEFRKSFSNFMISITLFSRKLPQNFSLFCLFSAVSLQNKDIAVFCSCRSENYVCLFLSLATLYV